MAAAPGALKAALLDRYGRTYAEDAASGFADKPAPLYQLLVLATLLSARISSDIAITAAASCSPPGTRHRGDAGGQLAERWTRWAAPLPALRRATATMLGTAASC